MRSSIEGEDYEKELAKHQEKIAEIIIRGHQYRIGKPTMVTQIMNLGYSREVAIQLFDSFEPVLLREVKKVEDKPKAKKDFWWGFLILLVGGAISLATFFAASGTGGTYSITTGTFVVGGFFLLRGVLRRL